MSDGRPQGVGMAVFPTALGWMALAASDRGIVELTLPKPTEAAARAALLSRWPAAAPLPDAAAHPLIAPLQRYMAGQAADLDSLPLDLAGHTEFRRRVWDITRRIPYGEIRTYTWVAQQVGKDKQAARAIGQAMSSNPIPIVIPCHRVVGSDGRLCGYEGGLAMKARLLAMERGEQPLL